MTDKKKLILIVDDNPQNLQVLGNLLTKNGFKLGFAMNGIQTLKFLNEKEPDLILLDIIMPEMDGYETCEKLKADERYRNIPVIFLTAKVETEEIVKGFQIGGVDYVTKPFVEEVLLARVKTHLALKEKTEKLFQLSTRDGLTNIANRRRFDEFLDSEWKRSLRSGDPVSLIIIDIDFFKFYNDHYGHQKGDDVLKKVAKSIKGCALRASDLTARYGGEEFAIVLGNTDVENAWNIANKVCQAIRDLNIPHELSKVHDCVTVSVGAGTIIPNQKSNKNSFIEQVDKQLYEAKKNGRNQVKNGTQTES